MAARRATQLLSPPATQLLPPPATLAAPSRRHQSGVSSHRPARPIHLHARSPPCPLHHRAIGSTLPRSSGHNRWSKIRHKKGAADAQRSALFSRFTHELYQALRPPSSPDPAFNQRLALAVSKAREGGMTKIAIEAVMARAKSAADGTGQNLTYEAMGPGGREAFMIECLTDNSSRAFGRVKDVLSKNGCRIAPVAFMFEKKGLIVVEPVREAGASFDNLFELAVEGGAEDVKEVDGDEGIEWEIHAPSNALASLTSLLSSPSHASAFSIRSSELAYIPTDPIPSDSVDEEKAESIMKVVDLLEAETDVVKVWTNLADG